MPRGVCEQGTRYIPLSCPPPHPPQREANGHHHLRREKVQGKDKDNWPEPIGAASFHSNPRRRHANTPHPTPHPIHKWPWTGPSTALLHVFCR